MPLFTGLGVGGGYQFATIGGVSGNSGASTFTDANGFLWQYYTWTGSGSMTVSSAGYMDLMVVGGGAGGGFDGGSWRAGGGGGGVRFGIFWVPAASHTVTVGGSGSSNGFGNTSSFGTVLRCGGGGRGFASQASVSNAGISQHGGGGSGGGVSIMNAGSGYTGGGAGGTVYGASNTSGITLNYNNSSVEYGGGGNQNANVSGTANTGQGGSGSGSGGSGIVVARIRLG